MNPNNPSTPADAGFELTFEVAPERKKRNSDHHPRRSAEAAGPARFATHSRTNVREWLRTIAPERERQRDQGNNPNNPNNPRVRPIQTWVPNNPSTAERPNMGTYKNFIFDDYTHIKNFPLFII